MDFELGCAFLSAYRIPLIIVLHDCYIGLVVVIIIIMLLPNRHRFVVRLSKSSPRSHLHSCQQYSCSMHLYRHFLFLFLLRNMIAISRGGRRHHRDQVSRDKYASSQYGPILRPAGVTIPHRGWTGGFMLSAVGSKTIVCFGNECCG
jgi:hypothetical protein